MNCQEARALVEDVLDRRMSEDALKDVELHLSRCRECRAFFEAEKCEHTVWFRALNEMDDIPAPSSNLGSRLAAVLEKPKRTLLSSLPRWFRRAAAIVIFIGGAAFASWLGVRPSFEDAEAVPEKCASPHEPLGATAFGSPVAAADVPASSLASDGISLATGPLSLATDASGLDARYRSMLESRGIALRTDAFFGSIFFIR